jgi:copper chaperone NosL
MAAAEVLRAPYVTGPGARVNTVRSNLKGVRSLAPFPRAATLLVLAAALLVLGALALPLWSVKLTAPQYPEGLGMKIMAHTVRGATSTDLDNINHLNRYIGMKSIEPDAIPELRIMPWIIIALSVTGFAVAAFRRRSALYVWIASFAAVCAAGLADFWRWEYDYGHNLDPRAVLKIPGMSYQPPIIGARQLLNFRALSVPATGGLMLMLALVLAAAAGALAWRASRRYRPTG